jgi:hypothetical protein
LALFSLTYIWTHFGKFSTKFLYCGSRASVSWNDPALQNFLCTFQLLEVSDVGLLGPLVFCLFACRKIVICTIHKQKQNLVMLFSAWEMCLHKSCAKFCHYYWYCVFTLRNKSHFLKSCRYVRKVCSLFVFNMRLSLFLWIFQYLRFPDEAECTPM